MPKIVKKATQSQENAVQRYIRETVGELRKVSWPERQEAINMTRIVLLVIIAMGAFLGLLDFVFSRLFAYILGT